MKPADKKWAWLQPLAWGWILVAGIYFLWEAVNYRRAYGRLAELQIHHFGSYAPLLTFLFLFGLLTLPAWILLRILRRRRSNADGTDAAPMTPLLMAARMRRIFFGFAGACALVALGFLLFAFVSLPDAGRQPQTISASDMGSIAVSEGPARLVGGEIGTIVFFGQDWFIGDHRMAFAPYRISGEGAAAQLFVQLDAADRNQLAQMTQRPSWSGLLVEGGLPGTARSLFYGIGVGIAEPHYTLYRDSYSYMIRYWMQSLQWGILSLFFLGFGLVQRSRFRHFEKEALAS